MTFTTEKFYGGLTVGLLIGLTINTIFNYIVKTIRTSQDEKNVGKSQQQEAKPNTNGEFKMALLVRHDLKMGKGKVAAQCAVASVIAYNKTKLLNLPSKCARVVLRAPDLKTLECIQKQCKLFGIPTAIFTEKDQMTVLAIGPANEASINAQFKFYK
ncbi:PREDICTED: peptidyl-tRNA hydrolase 2, mitochondrial-like isoform X3 [Diuraphis noxia]|uniref:peptidyl-tRNA hydrolase 2, mitochondrial-like isoform X3 n=1 Tax=Diuraphis noxia TaxID=143948 RepID=UPI000763B7CF|nr:PREDICTED: peptidyl-tRNA hydrolase 2, mitochondrial-like isoform X3 [Diuraphis noxia]